MRKYGAGRDRAFLFAEKGKTKREWEEEGTIIQPDLSALYRTTTTKVKPEYDNMVKHYILASILFSSMLAGHTHAVTAPHDSLRKLQLNGYPATEDNYGDWYDPYGVDTDDDYYSTGTDGYFNRYPDSYDDDYGGDQYDAYGVDYDDDYYASNDGYYYLYPSGAGTSGSSVPSFDSIVDSAVDSGGNALNEYIDNDCVGESVFDHACQFAGGAGAVNDLISGGIQDTIVGGFTDTFGRRLLQD
jgi:hypothetical protein